MLMLNCYASSAQYTIPATCVLCIVPATRPRPIPGISGAVLGSMQVNGLWIPVVDLAFLTTGVLSSPRSTSRVIVIAVGEHPPFGLLCEQARDTTVLRTGIGPRHWALYEDRGTLVRFCDPLSLVGPELLTTFQVLSHVSI